MLSHNPYSMAKTVNEKGCVAERWVGHFDLADNFQEGLVQFYFQCVLGNKRSYQELSNKYKELFQIAKQKNDYEYIIKLCLQTRDIKDGKGLCEITYMMIETIIYYIYYEKILPKKLLKHIFSKMTREESGKGGSKSFRPYGSWKDVKYFLDYFQHSDNSYYYFTDQERRSIIIDIIGMTYIPQMIKDRKNMSLSKKISLCGKWLPRESSSRFGWLARIVATQYHNEVFMLRVPKKKVYMDYRSLLTKFNKYLDTAQTHMTCKEWDQIDFEKVTNMTLFKSKKAFLNHKNIDEKHRHLCKHNFITFLNKKEIEGGVIANPDCMMPHYFVKDVLRGLDRESEKMVNMQWNGLIEELASNKNSFMKFCIPCIDVSPSMSQQNATPLQCAIGMGLACAELSHHNKAFAFSENPAWIDFDGADTFTKRVNIVRDSEWGSTTNIHKMFMKLLSACKSANVSDEDLRKHSMIIFSDMQFDAISEPSSDDGEDLFAKIKAEYSKCGYSDIPFLIFWNLRKTDMFPQIETGENMMKLSGNSLSLLKMFMNVNLEQIKKLDNWTLIKQALDNPRYSIPAHLFSVE